MGIDPGTVTSGYGIVEESSGRLVYIDAGGITTSAKLPFAERLKIIYDGLEAVIARHKPDAVAVESLFFAKNVQSALKLGHARGVALLAVMNAGLPLAEYSALEIKKAVVGYGQAEKEQVKKMVGALLNMRELPKPLDATDALAAAICHINSAKVAAALGRAKK